MFRMTRENKSNTVSAVPIHSSFSGTPPAPHPPGTHPMGRVHCLQPPTVLVECTDVNLMQNCSRCGRASILSLNAFFALPPATPFLGYFASLSWNLREIWVWLIDKRASYVIMLYLMTAAEHRLYFSLPLHLSWQRYDWLMNIYFSHTHLYRPHYSGIISNCSTCLYGA